MVQEADGVSTANIRAFTLRSTLAQDSEQLLFRPLLRQQGLAANHLACLHLGAKNIPRERRRARSRADRLLASLDAINEAALAGLTPADPFGRQLVVTRRRPVW